MARSIDQKIESTILSDGVGSLKEFAGLFNLIPPATITPSYEELISFEEQLSKNNVYNNITYIASPSMCTKLKTTEIVDKTAKFLWNADNDRVNGKRALSTNSVLNDGLVVGDFSDLLVCFWDFNCTIDKFSKAIEGLVRLTYNVYVDVVPRRLNSFITATL
jgi:hypothetical protein